MDRTRWLLTIACCAALSGLACGDSAKGSCEWVAEMACERACLCAPIGSGRGCCMVDSIGNGSRCYTGNACKSAFTRDLCEDSTKAPALFSACSEVIEQASCGVTTYNEPVLQLQPACEAILECKAGPCLD